jgi:hypothetical protein
MKSEDKRDAMFKNKNLATFICIVVYIHNGYFVTTAKTDVRMAQTYIKVCICLFLSLYCAGLLCLSQRSTQTRLNE